MLIGWLLSHNQSYIIIAPLDNQIKFSSQIIKIMRHKKSFLINLQLKK